jgi:head-tail adaptor
VPAITAGELASARATALQTLDTTAVVHAQSTVSDGAGGTTESFTPGSSIKARLAPAGGGERGSTGSRVDDRTTHIITLPAGTTVTAADRIVLGGRTYEATAVRRRTNEITCRVEAREL